MSSDKPNALNYLNLVAYIGNVVVTYGIGLLGFFGASTNGELSEKYQTLVTPVGWAFAIWSIIFISQLIFVILQFLSVFRASPLVQDGVKWYYIGVCGAQIAWTLFFSFEYIEASAAAMLSILAFLVTTVISQYNVSSSADSSSNSVAVKQRDFWLLKFPFAIHCGWIVAASFVNINVVLVKYELSSTIQVFAAIGSLVGVLIAAGIALKVPNRPEYVIPLVLVWATAGIAVELGNPKELIVETFQEDTISSIRYGAAFVSAAVGIFVAVVGIRDICSRRSGTEEEGQYLAA